MFKALIFILFISSYFSYAQTQISGTVYDAIDNY